jgi:hypothetical protein
MADQPGFFDLDGRYRALSAAGDPLERLAAVIDFELFRADLDAALRRSDRAKGGLYRSTVLRHRSALTRPQASSRSARRGPERASCSRGAR